MDWTCSTIEKMGNAYKIAVGVLLEDLTVGQLVKKYP
jgi:hypothetical protein